MIEEVLKNLVKEHEHKFDNTTMFGVPISELEEDELRACVCVLGEIEEQGRKDRQREREMMSLFRRKGI